MSDLHLQNNVFGDLSTLHTLLINTHFPSMLSSGAKPCMTGKIQSMYNPKGGWVSCSLLNSSQTIKMAVFSFTSTHKCLATSKEIYNNLRNV